MVCAPVRRDNSGALARGLSTVQVHKPCSISVDLGHYEYLVLKIGWISVDCGTTIFTTLISVNLGQYELFPANVFDFWHG